MAKDSAGLVCDPDRMNIQRMAAGAVVVCGGVFWSLAAFAGDYVFRSIDLTRAIGSALIPLALTVLVFVIGRYSESAATALLYGLSVSGSVWGLFSGWDPGLWIVMITFFIAPMAVAGTLYLAAWRMERTCGGPQRALQLLASPESSSL